MESQPQHPLPPGAAREQLRAARVANDASVRRATPPVGLILAVSFFCGALTMAPAHAGPRHVVTIVALVWFVVELVRMSARNPWRALRSIPRPRWNLTEAALLCVALLIGGLVGPHLLAGSSNSAAASWGFGAAVTVTMAACLFAASASYRHRNSRAWRR